jgi:DNA-binding beta-propeller fold protein YncE
MRLPIVVLTVLVATASLRAASPAGEGTRLVPDLRVREFGLCPDGHSVVVRSDASVLLVDWPGGAARPPATESDLPPCAATALGFSSDGRLYARTSTNGNITILDTAAVAARATLTGHLGTIGAVAFSPDGKWLASGGLDNDVRLWDVATGTCARTMTSPTHATFSIVWAPDGRTFYTAGASRTVTAWSAATGERLRESASLGKPINNLALSADGHRLGAGTFAAEGTNLPADIRVLDATTFAEQLVIPSPDGGAVGLAFSPDGHQLLWASSAGKGIMVSALEH